MGDGETEMKLYGIDLETHDPCLTDRGASWVYGEGGIIVCGVFNARTGKKTALVGGGGAAVKKLLLDDSVVLAGANIVYDLGWLCHEHHLAAKQVLCSVVDVSMAEQCIDEYQQYSLDALAQKYLGERKGDSALKGIAAGLGLKGDFRRHLKALWEKGHKDEICEYVMSDADQPTRIWERQKEILEKTGALEAATTNFKLIKIVLGMKQRGVRIDMRKREQNYQKIFAVQTKLKSEFERSYGKVNFNSSMQLAKLFDRERIPYRVKIRIKGYAGERPFAGSELWNARSHLKETFHNVRVKKGQLVLYTQKQYADRTVRELVGMGLEVTCNPNIDKHALKAAKKTHEAARAIADLKQVTSIIDKFLGPKFDRFIVKHGDNNYRIHADFNIVGARQTGRFSSNRPNLQQVPSKTVLFENTDHEIKLYTMCREIIVPDEGMLMGKADYSGQENRIIAHFAVGEGADEVRRKYNENPDLDFHGYIGDISGLYEEYGEDVGRKYAKNCGFGLGYGMRLPTMMETFGWDKEQAERITELYHEGAPFVKATMEKVSQVIVDRGYIKTLAGRREHLPSYYGKPNVRDAYKGFNKLIQGSAADMTKRAMVELDDRGLLDVFPLYLQAHDEIDFGVPKTAGAIRRLPEVQEVMEGAFKMKVPIRVDPEIGPDWGHVSGRRKSKKTKRLEPMEHFIERIIKEAGIEERNERPLEERPDRKKRGGVREVRVPQRGANAVRVQAHRGAGIVSAKSVRAVQEKTI
jgi:DNA polymerase I-like protein with 3'-5' exonuclease and polymerase domains